MGADSLQQEKQYPCVLIISHNVLSLTGNMGKTLHSYFDNWPSKRLCQIYFHSEVPTTHLCERYFRITDMDAIRGVFQWRKRGTKLTEYDIETGRNTTRIDQGYTAKIYQKARRRKPWMYCGRDFLWKLGSWKSKQLDRWIQECKPDVIFYASGDYTFSFDISLFISKKYNIPLVVSVVDDYYFQRPHDRGLLARYNTWRFRKTMDRTMNHAKGVFYVHPTMQKLYQTKFPINGAILYKNALPSLSQESANDPIKIAYFGSLGLRRDESIVEIGKTIRRLIPDGSVLLDVYSSENRPEILARMTEENGIRFCGAISAEDVVQKQEESNILVFVESIVPEMHERLRCSLSTKIPEYLASNRCMLAYGPQEAGSISYLMDYGVGCIATTPQELEKKLNEILFSADMRRSYAEKQMEIAKKNHSAVANHEILRNVLQEATN